MGNKEKDTINRSGTVFYIRPGIVKVNICGTDLLVATRAVWQECPRIRRLPKLWSVCWGIMEKGKSDRETVKIFSDLLKRPEEEIRKRLEKCFSTLAEEGYLLPSDAGQGMETGNEKEQGRQADR